MPRMYDARIAELRDKYKDMLGKRVELTTKFRGEANSAELFATEFVEQHGLLYVNSDEGWGFLINDTTEWKGIEDGTASRTP